jgi:hypothetical protein
MPFIRLEDIINEFDHVDDPDVLDKAKTNRALAHALEMSRPENWRGSGLTPEQILPLALDDAIPVAWVPPTDILQKLVRSPRDQRLGVLMSHQDSIFDQCRSLVTECVDPWIEDEQVLVDHVLDAYADRHYEAAMALAVAVGEPLALWASQPRVLAFDSEAEVAAWEKTKADRRNKYKLAELELAAVAPQTKLRRLDVLRSALIGPIPKFLTPFHGKPDEPIPETVSRHATVHKPTVKHFSVENSLLALMLVTSILRAQQEWCEEVRMSDVEFE